MKCSELLRELIRDGWFIVSQRGSHMQLIHSKKRGKIYFPFHGSNEVATGLEKKLRKQAGLK